MTVKPEKAQQNAASNERWPFDGSETGVAIILAEVSRNDSILQSYRDQFLVAETFTAAIAASAIFTTPNITFFVAVLGIPLLIGWVTVVRSQQGLSTTGATSWHDWITSKNISSLLAGKKAIPGRGFG